MNKKQLEAILKEEIREEKRVGGGSIADSSVVTTASGQRFFLKQGFDNDMFLREAEGLRELAKPGVLKVPEVIEADRDFLLLSYVEQGPKPSDFFEQFGQQLAEMHRYSSKEIGFRHNNFIGSTPQINVAAELEVHDWAAFYWNKRLLFQYRLCEKNGYANEQLRSLFSRLELVYPSLLQGSEEPSSLLHGDLWAGNYLSDKSGDPVLIDPAVYYGHREADLGMTRLFGGFTNVFYESYRQTYPLKPGYEEREPLYILYHVLNHLNLFGTGYFHQAISLMRQLVR